MHTHTHTVIEITYELEELLERLAPHIEGTGWECAVGGTSIYEIDGAGTKWAPVQGTRKYNKDAFIVIRRPQQIEPSKPNVEES